MTFPCVLLCALVVGMFVGVVGVWRSLLLALVFAAIVVVTFREPKVAATLEDDAGYIGFRALCWLDDSPDGRRDCSSS